MLEVFANLNSGYFVKSSTNGTEFILPPFFAGQSVTVRFHTLQPTFNPVTPFTEVQATSGNVSLTQGISGTAVNFDLAQVEGELYLQGTLTIPSTTGLIPSGSSYSDIIFGSQIFYNGDTIYLEANATIKIPSMSNNATATTFTYTLTAGQEDGLILDYSSMQLSAAPSYIFIPGAVQKTAADQVNLFASVLIETRNTSNVTAELSGVCDVTGRTFNFTVQP